MVLPFTEMRKTGRDTGWGGALGTHGFILGPYKFGVTCATSKWRYQVRDSEERPGLEMRGSVESQQPGNQETAESK